MLGSPRLRCFLALLLVVVCLLETTALARTTRASRRARLYYKRANVYFNLGEYKRAGALYRRAYKSQALAGFLFNIGQCYFNLGEHEEALRFYQRYLMEKPNAPNRVDVKEQIAAAKKALAEEEEARAQAQASQPTSAPASMPADPPEKLEPPPIDPPDNPPRRLPSRRSKIILWSGVAASSALLITGLITRAVALDQSSEYNDDATPLARQLDLKDSGEALTLTSNVTLGLGAALAVASGLYYWLGYRRSFSAAAAPTRDGGTTLIIRASF